MTVTSTGDPADTFADAQPDSAAASSAAMMPFMCFSPIS
jgi:hypothetical protein